MESSLNFLSLNVGMSASLAGLSTLITDQGLDIIFLQEVRLNSEQLNLLLDKMGFQAAVNIDSEHPTKPGTAFAWRKTLPVSDVSTLVLCRAQVATLGKYMLLNIYAPSGSEKKHERNVFFGQDIFRALNLNLEATWVIGGDFNCVMKSEDIEGGVGFQQKFCPALKDVVRASSLCDVFRHKYPRKGEFTFFRAGKAASRLDRFYISKGLVGGLKEVSHIASLSDHCGVKMELNVNVERLPQDKSPRSTYWKLNNAILEEEDFFPHFVPFWNRILKSREKFSDLAEWWDRFAKPEIKEFCIGFSSNRKCQRSQTKKFLLSYLKLVLVKKDWDEVARVKEKLNGMMKADAMGFVVRSRFKQNAEEEQASVYHAAREVKNDKNNLNSIKIAGKVVKDRQVIEDEILKYFGALFNGHHDVNLVDTGVSFIPDNQYLGDFLEGLGSLNDNDSDVMHKNIDMEELDEVVKNCENNKSPGLDGLTYEFYKTVWPVISEVFCQQLQCQLDRVKLIESNTVGATRLAPKVSGIPHSDELRPITLLNCDYKILSKLFVFRMLPILLFVIRSGQLCTVGNKNILFGVNNVLSSILLAKLKKLGGCLISLDFFKAYDRVLVDFLLLVMEKMNFSKKFCSWIKMLHVGAKTRFILQFLTEAIDVSFSIRQGDPLAMILYIINIEPLLLYLERRTVGLSICGISQCLEAYCDDLNILTNQDSDFLEVDSAIRKFEAVSGAILSRDKKCKVMGFGSWKDRVNWPLAYLKSVKELKVFWIFFCDSYRSLIKRNWDYRYEKFLDVVKSWSPRVLETLSQRVEVLKVFALSRVYYVASILPINITMIRKFEKEMGKFLWNASGKILRVSMDELKNCQEKGGLGLPCLLSRSKSLMLSQLLRLLRSGDAKSMKHVGFWLGELLGDFAADLREGDHAEDVPTYYDTLANLVVEARVADLVTTGNWRIITNKIIYLNHAEAFPVPKVELEAGVSFKCVWQRLSSPVLTAEAKDVLFLLVHNKLPVKERMFRIGLSVDPYCDHCPGGVICDVEHFFCACVRVSHVWGWLRARLVGLLGDGSVLCSDREFIHLLFPSSNSDREAVWLIGSYLARVWEETFVRGGGMVKGEQFFGFLRFKFKTAQLGARQTLHSIPGLLG